MAERIAIRFEGTIRELQILSDALYAEGLDADYPAPVEKKGWAQDAFEVTMWVTEKAGETLVGITVKAAAQRAIDRYKKRFPPTPGSADITIHE